MELCEHIRAWLLFALLQILNMLLLLLIVQLALLLADVQHAISISLVIAVDTAACRRGWRRLVAARRQLSRDSRCI